MIAVRHTLYRAALRKLLEREADLLVVGEADSADRALACVGEVQPDVLVLDLGLQGQPVLDLLRQLQGGHARSRVLVLGDFSERAQMVTAFRLGIRGVVHKDASPDLFVRGIRTVAREDYWIKRETAAQLLSGFHERNGQVGSPQAPRPASLLTRRERQIAAAVAAGASNHDIATDLGLHLQTVKNHLSAIFDKLGVSTRLELAVYALHHGLDSGA